jgi:GT2 family glycosyltransferase
MLAARGSSFLLLNSDAFMADGALRAMLDRLAAEGDPVAAVAPQLRNVDGSLQRSIRGFPTAWRYATEFWYLRRLAPRARWANAMYGAGIDPDQPSRIEWATGACLLVPRASVDAVGLMDEGYFMYGEEVDWLHRMRESGRSVAYEPAAQVVHVGGGSARKEWGRMYEQQLVNHVRYMQRCEGQSAARRTKRVIVSGLRMRSIVWRALQRERTDAFASGARAVKRIDLAIDPVAQVPAWSPATNPPAASIDR